MLALGYCLVQQVAAKHTLDIGLAVADNHQAGDGFLTRLGDHSKLEVLYCGSRVFEFLLGCWADVASFAAADKEGFACLGIDDLLEFSILADDELLERHSLSDCEVAIL